MESRVSGNAHARFGVGENPEVSSPKDYLSPVSYTHLTLPTNSRV